MDYDSDASGPSPEWIEKAQGGLLQFRSYAQPPSHSEVEQLRMANDKHLVKKGVQALSKEELRDSRDDMNDVPIVYEHERTTSSRKVYPGGVVVRKSQLDDGTVDVFLQVFHDTPSGRRLLQKMQEGNLEFSWSSIMDPVNGIKYNEGSIVKKGLRDGCKFVKWVPNDASSRKAEAIKYTTFRPKFTPNNHYCTPSEFSKAKPREVKPWHPNQQVHFASDRFRSAFQMEVNASATSSESEAFAIMEPVILFFSSYFWRVYCVLLSVEPCRYRATNQTYPSVAEVDRL